MNARLRSPGRIVGLSTLLALVWSISSVATADAASRATGIAVKRTAVGTAAATVPSGTTLLSEGFSADATGPNAWAIYGSEVCLTAGDVTTPATSIPSCPASQAHDALGQGALQITTGGAQEWGGIISTAAFPTSNGLQITFTDYAFKGSTPGADGLAFFLTDGSKPVPAWIGARAGGLSYAPYGTSGGTQYGYVGVGFDEFGDFSNVGGGPGQIPETIAVRGAAATNYAYLGGALNAAGHPASLPFNLDAPGLATRPVNAPTIRATLTAAGVLTVAIDRHDGNGFVQYYTQAIVGVHGQPQVPATVRIGLGASTSANDDTHQISGLAVSALNAPVVTTTELWQPFSASSTPAGNWQHAGAACLTAGTSATPATSIPACGNAAPTDAPGSGVLELNGGPTGNYSGMVTDTTPLSTAAGLQITFTDYAFDGTTPGGDGVALFFTDASKPLPTQPGASGGSLAYAASGTTPGIANAYLGVGLDETGNFSNVAGGPGRVPETIAIRGAAATNYQYIGGATNAAGVAASLPFTFDAPTAATRPAGAPSIRATLTPAGMLTVAVDRHDGAGYTVFYAQTIVGVGGQPAVPAKVYVGLTASIAGSTNIHQVGGLLITTANGTPIADAGSNPPQIVSSNGSLVFNVSVQQNATTGNPQYVYNGSTVPPTLRLLPGDTLVVNLTNDLPVPPASAGYTNHTNLHFHGLHVSPQAPGDDSIDMLAAPGQSLHYAVQIPANHPPGLYWYHSHSHEEAERQTLAGMSGALIIDGIAAYTPQVTNMIERILVARDAPLAGAPLPDANPATLYAMRWAMQHGVSMHAGSAAVTAATKNNELHAASTMQSRNPYVKVNPAYRTFSRAKIASAADSHCVAGSPEAPVKALTINGQTNPTLRIAPGEQQFWRLVNAGADTYLDVAVDNTMLQIVALDGVPLSSGVGTPAAMSVAHWVLPPASRVEFIVTGPPAGTTAYLRTNCFDAGEDGLPMPAQILATIDPTAGAAAVRTGSKTAVARISPKAVRFVFHTSSAIARRQANGARTTSSQRSAAALRSAAVAATQTIYYSDQNTINGVAYDPAAPPQFYAQSGTVQQWTIVNESEQVHTFHIHQVHFLVQSINGTPQAQQYVMDNVNVPAATTSGPGSVTLLLDFTDPTIIGTFLLHCHILAHEDGGMMAKIRVGLAPPLTLSTSTVTFAKPTSGVQDVTIGGGTPPYSVTGCTGVANAAITGTTLAILPAGAGACVLTIADSSTPSLTSTETVEVAAPQVVTLSTNSVAFTSPTAPGQTVTISGGTPPYSAAGCTGIAVATIASATLGVAPAATGTCSLTISDANGNTAVLSVSVNAALTSYPTDNLTFHQNAMRTGWYQNETTLNAANVASDDFGKIATLAAPAGMPGLGKVYAQPLFVTSENVAGTLHNLVIVAGAADQVYAFDETTHAVVWHRDFTNAAAGIRQQLWTDTGCADVNPDIGIIATPVIDRTRDAMYVVVATMENGVPYLRLHAIGLASGLDLRTPTVISGTVPLATGGTASVNALGNFSRAALLEADGNIYVGLGSHCDLTQNDTIHGWMAAYSAATLQETGSLVDLTGLKQSAQSFLGAVWMSGYGPAADAQGRIYIATGNGSFDGVNSFAMSIVELPGTLNSSGIAYFSPITEAADSSGDKDLGAGGVMVLPDQTGAIPHLVVAGGKCSQSGPCYKYLLNRDALGGQQTNNAGAAFFADTGGGIWGGPAYFVDSTGAQHVLYGGNPLNTYTLSAAPLGLSILSSTTIGCLECRDEGSQPIVSSNGTTAGSFVAWALKTPGNSGGTIMLYAFNPLNMTKPLFSAAAGNWTIGTGATTISGALVSPTVANGRVYVPTDGSVSVFGLTP